jgi:hypothetical protein
MLTERPRDVGESNNPTYGWSSPSRRPHGVCPSAAACSSRATGSARPSPTTKADARAWLRALLGVSVRHDRADVVGPQRGTPAPIAWDFARPDKAPNSAPHANEPGRSRRRTFLNRDRLVARRTDHCG